MPLTLPAASSTATATLNAPGIGSGLDVKGLVTQLMAVEQRPMTLLNAREAAFQAKLSSLGSVTGSLAAVQVAAKALASASTVQNSATSTDSQVLTATADSDAAAGNFNVTVKALAQSQKLIATGQASTTSTIGSGASTTLTISFGTIASVLGPVNGTYSDASFTANPDKVPISVVIGGNNTLAGIRDAINSGNAGVTASIINDGSGSPYRLTITSNDTGVANSIRITSSGDSAIGSLLAYDPTVPAGQNIKQTQAGQNAALTIDGVDITSATNTVVGAIPSVTLNLTKPTEAGKPVIVAVQGDSSSLTAALEALVKAYNSAHTLIAGVTAKGAVLQGDQAVLTLQRRVDSIIGSAQPAGGAYSTLSSLGIGFKKDGTLAFDPAKVNKALRADPVHVAALTLAIGNAINTAATDLLGPAGPVPSEQDGINRSIKDIGTRRVDMQHRLDLTRARYQNQFSGLDTLLSSMAATSTYLTQQLANLPNLFNNKG